MKNANQTWANTTILNLKNHHDTYTIIGNELLENNNLSAVATKVMMIIFKHKYIENFSIKTAFIKKFMVESIKRINRAINELEAAGYILKRAIQLPNGRMRGWKYEVYDTPQQHVKEFWIQKIEKKIAKKNGYSSNASNISMSTEMPLTEIPTPPQENTKNKFYKPYIKNNNKHETHSCGSNDKNNDKLAKQIIERVNHLKNQCIETEQLEQQKALLRQNTQLEQQKALLKQSEQLEEQKTLLIQREQLEQQRTLLKQKAQLEQVTERTNIICDDNDYTTFFNVLHKDLDIENPKRPMIIKLVKYKNYFTIEAIKKACEITTLNPNVKNPFAYVVKILDKWKENNVSNLAEVETYNNAWEINKEKIKPKKIVSSTQPFYAMQGHNLDYNEIDRLEIEYHNRIREAGSKDTEQHECNSQPSCITKMEEVVADTNNSLELDCPKYINKTSKEKVRPKKIVSSTQPFYAMEGHNLDYNEIDRLELEYHRRIREANEEKTYDKDLPFPKNTIDNDEDLPFPRNTIDNDEDLPFPKNTIDNDEDLPFPKNTIDNDEDLPFPKNTIDNDEDLPFPKNTIDNDEDLPFPKNTIDNDEDLPFPKNTIDNDEGLIFC
ncbi:MAG: hypothetical protein ATN33_08490 [Epulopiscium sp. Nele67-Bin001]|nr:MAG: hypothetical protein ATN33_08490 [Epulopiscium sp. Nele67-Bin001]